MPVNPSGRTGIAYLPLHSGKAPSWLFQRMVKLAREISIIIIEEFGPEEILRRLSDPFWFQAFGCVLGFDWHSSGLTTTVCGALKEGVHGLEKELGLFIAGGKGGVARQTPLEIQKWAEKLSLEPERLVYASRMSAKVDSTALQDGYQLYHHCFIFTRTGKWAVIQQGMNNKNNYARRYHWLGEKLSDFVNEPHTAVHAQAKAIVLNLVASESASARKTITEIASTQRPEITLSNLEKLKTLKLPARHQIEVNDIHPENLKKILISTYDNQPDNFERLISLQGVGPKTIRALSLISELIYGVSPSYRDPAVFSFAHGGKDGIPYPIDRQTYDRSIELLARLISRARLSVIEKREAFGRLDQFRSFK